MRSASLGGLGFWTSLDEPTKRAVHPSHSITDNGQSCCDRILNEEHFLSILIYLCEQVQFVLFETAGVTANQRLRKNARRMILTAFACSLSCSRHSRDMLA